MPSSRFRDLPVVTKVYISGIVAAGSATVLQSFYDLAARPIGWNWTLLAILTLLSGSATVRLPSLPATISVSETFVFTSVLLFGSSAGTLTVALDALVISFWSYRTGHPTYKIVFNVCALPLTIWIAAHLFFLFPGIEPLVTAPTNETISIRELIGPLLVFTIVYFSLNSWIITLAISLERNLPAFSIWRNNFLWLSLNYFGGASVAALLVSYTRRLDYTYLLVIVPLLIVLYFTFSMSMGRIEDANRHLTQLNSLYMSTIETLAMAIDAKDQITHGHIRRVQAYAISLTREVGVTDISLIRAVEAAALLHDMGKLAVPEYILNKPGPLTSAEFDKMKLHSSVGADILSAIDFPYPVVPIVRHHHENWDGTGYPDGLSGTSIPIGARILAVVDCFDALTSDRPYRPRLSDKEALRILVDCRGSMYDPLVVDTFLKLHPSLVLQGVPTRPTASLLAIGTSSMRPVNEPQARSLEDIAGSTEEMVTLFDLARSLASPMTLDEVSDVVSRHLRRLIPCSLCIVFVYQVKTDELAVAHSDGENASLVAGLRMGVGQRLSGWVAAHRQTIRNSDPVLDLGESARAIEPRPRSCLSTPLEVESELIGVLTLYSTGVNAFTEEHQRVIEVVARQVAPIVKRSGSNESPVRPVALGGLTKIAHLRQFVEAIGISELPKPTSILLMTLDTAHGSRSQAPIIDDHRVSNVVELARRHLRAGDLLFRQSATEFLVLLLKTDLLTASSIGSRIQRSAEDAPSAVRLHVSAAAVGSKGEERLSVLQLVEQAAASIRARRSVETKRDSSSDSIH